MNMCARPLACLVHCTLSESDSKSLVLFVGSTQNSPDVGMQQWYSMVQSLSLCQPCSQPCSEWDYVGQLLPCQLCANVLQMAIMSSCLDLQTGPSTMRIAE